MFPIQYNKQKAKESINRKRDANATSSTSDTNWIKEKSNEREKKGWTPYRRFLRHIEITGQSRAYRNESQRVIFIILQTRSQRSSHCLKPVRRAIPPLHTHSFEP